MHLEIKKNTEFSLRHHGHCQSGSYLHVESTRAVVRLACGARVRAVSPYRRERRCDAGTPLREYSAPVHGESLRNSNYRMLQTSYHLHEYSLCKEHHWLANPYWLQRNNYSEKTDLLSEAKSS